MSPTPAEREKLAAQAELSDEQIADIDRRLDRMDASSKQGPWTRKTLQLIAEQPGVVSTVLARQMQRERYEFKGLVRRLKDIGLTYALDVGYCLSPRGRAYLKSRSG
jgi:uncharacterized protein YjiS (DUF1127 family)